VTIAIHFTDPTVKVEFNNWLLKEKIGYWYSFSEPEKCIFSEAVVQKVEKWLIDHGVEKIR